MSIKSRVKKLESSQTTEADELEYERQKSAYEFLGNLCEPNPDLPPFESRPKQSIPQHPGELKEGAGFVEILFHKVNLATWEKFQVKRVNK